jgi:hypothetical protein
MEKTQNTKSFLLNCELEKFKNFIKNAESTKQESDEFNRKNKLDDKEIENILKKATNISQKLEKLINNYKYFKISFLNYI